MKGSERKLDGYDTGYHYGKELWYIQDLNKPLSKSYTFYIKKTDWQKAIDKLKGENKVKDFKQYDKVRYIGHSHSGVTQGTIYMVTKVYFNLVYFIDDKNRENGFNRCHFEHVPLGLTLRQARATKKAYRRIGCIFWSKADYNHATTVEEALATDYEVQKNRTITLDSMKKYPITELDSGDYKVGCQIVSGADLDRLMEWRNNK